MKSFPRKFQDFSRTYLRTIKDFQGLVATLVAHKGVTKYPCHKAKSGICPEQTTWPMRTQEKGIF